MPAPSNVSRRLRPLVGLALALLAFLIAFLVTVNRTAVRLSIAAATPPSAATTVAPSPSLSLSDVARAALNRTVTIESLRSGDEGLGTGWLLDSRGDFVTNAHVVEGQETVRLRARNGSAHVGVVVGMDRDQDIALVRSQDGFDGAPLPVRSGRLGDLPQPVVAIASGAATGHADITPETATRFAADVPVTGDTTTGLPQTSTEYHDMLVIAGSQIYPGNSGGPVLDLSGHVVGIVTLASRSAPEGYAIPVDRVVDELLGFAAR